MVVKRVSTLLTLFIYFPKRAPVHSLVIGESEDQSKKFLTMKVGKQPREGLYYVFPGMC